MDDMTSIGFTGTQNVLIAWQKKAIRSLLRYHRALGFTEFHHGDCVVADEFAATCAWKFGYHVVCHPPVNERLRAFTSYHEIRPALEYLDRNTEIVNDAHIGIAAPDSEVPKPRSGTWSTIRKMADIHLPRIVITPTTFWACTPDNPLPKGHSVDH